MKKVALLLITAIFSWCNELEAQSNTELFLIAGQGCPGNCADEYSEHYPVHLLRLRNDSLQVVDTLASGNEYVFKIASYFDYKMVLLYKSDLFTKKKSILKISYEKDLQIDSIVRTFSDRAFLSFMFYLVDVGQPWAIIEYFPDFNNSLDTAFYYGLNMITGKDSLFSNRVIEHIHSEGEQGIALVDGYLNSSEMLRIGTKRSPDNKPIFTVNYPRLRTPDTCKIILPKLEQLVNNFKYITLPDNNPQQYRAFPIYTRHYICVYTSSKWDKSILNGTLDLEVFNATDSIWKKVTFPGVFDEGWHLYGSWLAGYVAYESQWGFQQKMKKNGAIPGLKFRQQKSLYGNSTFDTRAKDYQLYPEGILYLYNINTNKYIEWDALENGEHQGDSEIILVQDNTVYYRINDKIYKAPIINGEKLGEPVLLVTDSRVPDIHWAFLAKDQSSASPDIK